MTEAAIRTIAGELELSQNLLGPAVALLPRSRPADPLADIVESYRALARAACGEADHRAELTVAMAMLERMEDAGARVRAEAWLLVIAGTCHLETDPSVRVERIRGLALEAAEDLRVRAAQEELGPGQLRSLLDPIAHLVLDGEVEAGQDPSALSGDLARRKLNRTRPSPQAVSFSARHLEGLMSVWARDGRGWFAGRYRDRHGSEPPEGWWVDDAESPMGGVIDPEYGHLFDAVDRADFFAEMEARYRVERGLPAAGEGLVSQRSLKACVEDAVSGAEVIAEARLPWLDGQRLDIYVPDLAVAFEYQGEQHYFPLEHWGGDEGLAMRQELDERKRDACARAGVRLIEWRYDEPISVDAVRRKLRPGLADT